MRSGTVTGESGISGSALVESSSDERICTGSVFVLASNVSEVGAACTTFTDEPGNNDLKFDMFMGVVSMLDFVPQDGIDMPEYLSASECDEIPDPGDDTDMDDGVVFDDAVT